MSVSEKFQEIEQTSLLGKLNYIKNAYRKAPYPTIAERKASLQKLKRLVVDNQVAICEAISADFNTRSHQETLTAEVLPSVMGIKHALAHVSGWMRSSHRLVPMLFQPAFAKIKPQPLGVVGVISTWNYPLYLTVGPLTSALAAGNRAMVKVSESSPIFGALFDQLIQQYFADSEIQVINGEVDVAQAFSALPFDHMLFTGSVAVGKHIMRAASENLTPVTLELGGKSPVVIEESMPIREAASRLVFPKCINSGQTCVAPDYVLCPKGTAEEFVQHFLVEAKRQYGDIRTNADYSAVINSRQRDRLVAYVNEAKDQGAKVYVAGENDDLSSYGNKLPPILLTGVPESCAVMQEEIFGPILPVIEYDSVAQSIDYINDRPRPLALYVFSYSAKIKRLFENNTHSGALMFNEALIHFGIDNLPIGGVGPSGMGHYHSKEGFQTFSKMKPIVSKGRISSLKLVYPPYKPWLMSIIFKLFGR